MSATYIPYFQKLKDPRWQRRRLEIMKRDNFACQFCGAKEKTLNIHHTIYRKGENPWDYDDDELVTLCEGCHKNVEDDREMILQALGKDLKSGMVVLDLVSAMTDSEETPWLRPLARSLAKFSNLHMALLDGVYSAEEFLREAADANYEIIRECIISMDDVRRHVEKIKNAREK